MLIRLKFYCQALSYALCASLLLCSCSSYQPQVSNLPTPAPQTLYIEPTEELTPPEPEKTVAQEIKELKELGSWDKQTVEPQAKEKDLYDFPVTINRQVEYYLNFFQHKHHKSFERWLTRSGRYLPMIKSELAKAGLPKDLVYLPMIESGYSLTAYSKARAVGPWQFIRSTAINYGLTVNRYIDERRDPLKSTQAACRYLSNLYSQFNSWPLAVAAYNAGEGKIRKAIRRYKTRDFWELAQHSYLKAETKRYVPKLTAAIIIAKNPAKYGFKDQHYAPPLKFETAEIPPWTSLKAVAIACNTDYKILRQLNHHLRQGITPPSLNNCEINIPVGKGDILAENLPRVMTSTSTHYKTHIVRRHDTIGKVCRKYQISKITLLKANNLHKAKLRRNSHLRIPYQLTKYTLLSKSEFKRRQQLAKAGKDKNRIVHRIRAGETVSQIAKHYKVSTQMIALWNRLPSVNTIRAGQSLIIHINSHITLASTGNTKTNHKIFYKVQGGDSLWTIARKFNTHTNDIKRWNNLKNNLIHPGLKLILKKDEG